VDLRPIASHSDPAGDYDSSYSAESITYGREAGASPEPPADGATPASRRRSRTGLSLYIQHTLNRGRMRDATPEERLAALRRLRTVNRASEAESGSARNRISARLSRAFDSERRHSSQRGSYAGWIGLWLHGKAHVGRALAKRSFLHEWDEVWGEMAGSLIVYVYQCGLRYPIHVNEGMFHVTVFRLPFHASSLTWPVHVQLFQIPQMVSQVAPPPSRRFWFALLVSFSSSVLSLHHAVTRLLE